MMTDVKAAIERAFKSMLSAQPYDKVSVSKLCDEAHTSRRTFYKYFQGKEGVVEALFDQHVIAPLRDLNRLLGIEDRASMHKTFAVCMYEGLFAERDYYTNLVRPMRGNDDTFIRVATQQIYRYNMEYNRALERETAQWRRDYAAYFFASSQAMYMQKWISDGMEVSPKDLADLYTSMTISYWQKLSGT